MTVLQIWLIKNFVTQFIRTLYKTVTIDSTGFDKHEFKLHVVSSVNSSVSYFKIPWTRLVFIGIEKEYSGNLISR